MDFHLAFTVATCGWIESAVLMRGTERVGGPQPRLHNHKSLQSNMIRAIIFRKEARPTELRETKRKVERVFLSNLSNLGLGILVRQS